MRLQSRTSAERRKMTVFQGIFQSEGTRDGRGPQPHDTPSGCAVRSHKPQFPQATPPQWTPILRNLHPSGVPSLGRKPGKTVFLGHSVLRFYRSVLRVPWTGALCESSESCETSKKGELLELDLVDLGWLGLVWLA